MSTSIDDLVPLPHPVKRYVRWFEELPPDVQASLALQMLNTAPEGLFRYSDADLPNIARPFLERIRRGERTAGAALGLALTLRELTDWAFSPYATPEAWERGAERLREAHAAITAREGPEVAGDLDHLLRARPFNSRVFVREYETWVDFRNRFLNSAFLDAWYRLAQIYPTE